MKNLSRQLRPKNFEQLVGQDLVKSMLKNSLFLDKIFPSYLFSGQRGCGKTSTARIFAKALNCFLLDDFRKDPKSNSVPCLECVSCRAMDAATHPDFVELDAASNTGVDNVRQIIETASYQPAMGRYRVFLIDEAHMLSKAAFNAFLKSLEEPCSTAVFILATTEIEKIPLTVRSRSFLSLFSALPPQVLYKFLVKVSQDLKVEFEPQALWYVVKLSQGCPRDALNVFEQLLFCDKSIISGALAKEVFPYFVDEAVLNLSPYLFQKNLFELKKYFEEKIKPFYSAVLIFESLQQGFIAVLNQKLDLSVADGSFYGFEDELKSLSSLVSMNRLKDLMDLFWQNQRAFFYSNHKENFLDYLFFLACQDEDVLKCDPNAKIQQEKYSRVSAKVDDKPKLAALSSDESSLCFEKISVVPKESDKINVGFGDEKEKWQNFLLLKKISYQKMLHACLASAVSISKKENMLEVTVPKKNSFMENLLLEHANLISEALPQIFEGVTKIALNSLEAPQKKKIIDENFGNSTVSIRKSVLPLSNNGLNLKNIDKWPISGLMLKYFPGKITIEVQKK